MKPRQANRSAVLKSFFAAGLAVPFILLACQGLWAQALADWPSRIRELAARGSFLQAREAVDDWIRAYPEDRDAKAWHARLEAWTHHWPEAEAEYRTLLEKAPADTDLLMGLADLLTWQERYVEAEELLGRASSQSPERTDCRLQLARVLERMGRRSEATAQYKALLDSGAAAAEAKKRLTEMRESAKNELRLGATADLLSYATDAQAFAASLATRWDARWRSSVTGTQYNRFGKTAILGEATTTYRLTGSDSVTVGGGGGMDRNIVPRATAQVGYDHGMRFPGQHALRGVELLYDQQWLWYRSAGVTSFSPAVVVYLPKNCNWLFRASAARLTSTGSGPEWRPAVLTRFTFPIGGRLTAHALFAAGVESFGTVDQLQLRSTHTGGVGVRLRVAPGQELSAFMYYQHITPGRSQTSIGLGYALRL